MQVRDMFEKGSHEQKMKMVYLLRNACDQSVLPWALKQIDDRKLDLEVKKILANEMSFLVPDYKLLITENREQILNKQIDRIRHYCQDNVTLDSYEQKWAKVLEEQINKSSEIAKKFAKNNSWDNKLLYQEEFMILGIFTELFWQSDDLEKTLPLAVKLIRQLDMNEDGSDMIFSIVCIGLSPVVELDFALAKNNKSIVQDQLIKWWIENKDKPSTLWYIGKLEMAGYKFEDKKSAKEICQSLITIIRKGDTVEAFSAIETFNVLFLDKPELVSFRPRYKSGNPKEILVAEELIRAEASRAIAFFCLEKTNNYVWDKSKGTMIKDSLKKEKLKIKKDIQDIMGGRN
ncbi:MAG: hypothetical protein JEZ07_16300 [Phycisphaerae bacterium]|nr:hypothetical protein [Phycisphaerae bacterium]